MEAPAIFASALGAATNLQSRANASACLVASLTDRQRDVLQGMVDGLLNKQIAIRLSINEKTVKMHRAALLERLRASNSAAAIRIGVEAEFAQALAQSNPQHQLRKAHSPQHPTPNLRAGFPLEADKLLIFNNQDA